MFSCWGKRAAWLIGSFSLFRLFIMGRTGLGDAEAYYWVWSQRLDLSYYDHPPMVAWLIRLFTEVGGDSSFYVRLPSVLLFVGLSCLLYRLTVYLFESSKAAFYALLIFNLCPLFAIAALQMVPDIPAAFFWMVFVYLVAVLLKEDRPMLWYPVGVVIGLGLLSKYLNLPLIPFTLLMLGWHKEYRHHLRQPHIYLGGVLGLIIFSPVLIWNWQNNFPSFKFHLEGRHSGGSHFSLNHMGEFLGGQALYMSPLIWFAILYVGWLMAKKVFKEKDKRFIVPFWLGVPPLLFFLGIGLYTQDSEPHWTAFGYLTLFVGWGGILLEDSRPKLKKFTIASVALSSTIIAAFYIHLFTPILPIKPKYDIVNELFGWDIAGKKIDEMMASFPKGEKRFLIGHHNLLTSQASFATKGRWAVYTITSTVDEYDFFEDRVPPIGGNFIFLADNRFKNLPSQYYLFDKVEPPVEIEIYRGSRWARTFYLYKGYGYRGEKPY